MLGLVTAEVAAPLDPDLEPLADACRDRLGADRVQVVDWHASTVDWSSFDAVVIRSTWDYTTRLDEFLAWVDRASTATSLVNDGGIVRWNADKVYLRDLADDGIPVTPTVFVEPGHQPPAVEGVHVVKPSVGAGSAGARRCEPDEVTDHVAALHRDGRTAMVQPYLERLDALGETAHCFVPGPVGSGPVFSHAFGKAAILRSTDVEQVGDLFAKEDITTRVPTDAELDLARAVLDAPSIRRFGDVGFARIDIAPMRGPDGTDRFVVMEAELIEPSFYFEKTPGSVDVFADALVARLNGERVSP